MRILINNFTDVVPSVKRVVIGNCIFFFANKHLIECKYDNEMSRYNPGGSYAQKFFVYRPLYNSFQPEIYMFAGINAKAFAINFGHAQIYFSYDKLIGINVYDKVYVLNESESESKTMKKHMTLLRKMADSENVSQEVLNSLIDRYFGMFERPISCLC